MFGFGFSELLIIFLLIIILVKPEELPSLIHQIGKFYGTLKRISMQIRDELESFAPEEKNDIKRAENTISYEKKEEKNDRNN